jgi:hypothetical protein
LAFLKYADAFMQVSNIKGLTVCFKVINFTFQVLSFSFGFDPAAIEV